MSIDQDKLIKTRELKKKKEKKNIYEKTITLLYYLLLLPPALLSFLLPLLSPVSIDCFSRRHCIKIFPLISLARLSPFFCPMYYYHQLSATQRTFFLYMSSSVSYYHLFNGHRASSIEISTLSRQQHLLFFFFLTAALVNNDNIKIYIVFSFATNKKRWAYI